MGFALVQEHGQAAAFRQLQLQLEGAPLFGGR